MTAKERTGKRDSDLFLSRWIRKYGPDSKTGFGVSDIDFSIDNHNTKKSMIIEVKNYQNEEFLKDNMSSDQKQKYIKLAEAFECLYQTKKWKGWNFLGLYYIQFKRRQFKDGVSFAKVDLNTRKFNFKKSSEKEILKLISSINDGYEEISKIRSIEFFKSIL